MRPGPGDATRSILAAEAALIPGDTFVWPPGHYNISGDITVTKPGLWDMRGVTINSDGGRFILGSSDFTLRGGRLNFASGDPAQSRDRAVRIGGGGLSAEYVASPIVAGATSFLAADAGEATSLERDDWVCVVSVDPANWVQVEYKQVAAVDGAMVHVASPFVQEFPAVRAVHWVKLINPIRNVKVDGLAIVTSNTVDGNVGIDAQPGVIDLTVQGCRFDIANGLACNLYGQVNPRALNNVVRQTGRRLAVSSCHGGEVSGNVLRNGSLTVETGTFGTLFERNDLSGIDGGPVIYHSDANFCRYRNNLIMGDGSAIGILVQCGSDNSFQGDVIGNVSEGIVFTSKDTSLAVPPACDRNSVVYESIRAETSVKIADSGCHDNAITGFDAADVADSGTNTRIG